ncbi:MAG: DUF4332 domain-containing protein [Porphyromonas sp.]|nr:DUF4332 domain-containing protein [Porphyromonas sp.]
MVNYKLEQIKAIEPACKKKLLRVGIENTLALSRASKTRAMRKKLSEQTKIDERRILKWANMVDLLRINGIGADYVSILVIIGVGSMKNLSTADPEYIVQKMAEVNDKKNFVKRTPLITVVSKWIEQAKVLPRGLEP